MKLSPALQYSHDLLKQVVNPGDMVIDATVGNGHDTLLLAQLVGENGHVLGFDIQASAIEATTTRLETEHLNNVYLHLTGHQNVDQYLNEPLAAAIFNLGYLPSGDKSIITTGNTTIEAIKKMLPHLKPNGIICLVIYYGHPGGDNERAAVEKYTATLPQQNFNVLEYQFINQVNTPPKLIVIQRR